MDEIKELGAAKQGNIHCLTIVGQIEGHQTLPDDTKSTKYEHILPLIAAIEESPEIQGLLILLNTMGGDVEAGLAIAEMIAGMTKPTVSLVLGGGHSIGVPLAVAAKCSMIAPSAAMTIHPVRLNGVVIGELLRPDPGADRPLRDRALPHLPGGVSAPHDQYRRACQRRRQRHLWGRGGGERTH